MKKNLLFPLLIVLACTVPAYAGVSVSSPGSGAQVPSPFNLSADAPDCSNQPIAAMGYSLDNSSDTAIVYNASINTQVSAGTGYHVVHVKAWGNQGAVCVTDVALTITPGSAASVIPSYATSVSSIQTLGDWKALFDTGTGSGWANGWMTTTGSPSQGGQAREFVTNYGNYGGERYTALFGDDTSATNFFYDSWVYLTSNAGNIANLEMDMNQTMPNGLTAIFGFQCDGYSSTWDYTKNAGTPWSPNDQWVHSSAYCNPRGWGRYTWHHVQVWYSRDDSGNITYHSVWLDGLQEPINATVNSAFALGWAPALVTNFQMDGLGGGGTATVYLDNITIYRW